MSPLVGVVAETGDVRAVRAPWGNASLRKKVASFIDECVAANPKVARPRNQLWIRVDSAGYSPEVVDTATKHSPALSITCIQNTALRKAIETLAADPTTTLAPAKDATGDISRAKVAETTYHFTERDLPLIVLPQKKASGQQLSYDDLGDYRFFAIITNVPPIFGSELR